MSCCAQCDFIVNETDEFTKRRQVATEAEFGTVLKKKKNKMQFTRVDTLLFLSLDITFFEAAHFIKKGQELILKLENDSIVHLTAGKTTPSDRTEYTSHFFCSYYAERSILEELSRTAISKFRLCYVGGSTDQEIASPEARTGIKNAIRCLLDAP